MDINGVSVLRQQYQKLTVHNASSQGPAVLSLSLSLFKGKV